MNGVQLWVKAGPLQFQPGELAKILLIVFLAAYLRDNASARAGRLKDFGPLLAIWGAAMLVRVQTSDLGSALLTFGIFLGMLYAATGGRSTSARASCSSSQGPPLQRPRPRAAARCGVAPAVDGRARPCTVTGQLDWQNCDSYQLVKSLYAIANGGYGGTGLGQGTFTTVDGIELIPHLNTDFIYSALDFQELGLIGAAAPLPVHGLRRAGMRVALVAQDGFSKLLAAGLTFGFALQTFIIVGGVLRVVPLTGITLPFVSYGGSSILANFVMLALLLLVSSRANATGGAR